MPDLRSRLDIALSHRYQLERELGRGGMATVWLARDLKHGRRVALKVLHPELAASLGPDRFLREIEIAASLAHPNILPMHESGEADGFLYYVMPYVDGESLRDRLRREIQLPVEEAIRIAREVADALGYAHARGLIHRDIKPENILLEAGHAVVADFGVARAIETAGSDQLTATGLVVGTPAYMSPEQAGGSDRLDGRSDLYSLGCVLYEMLAGEPPFSAPTPQALAAKHLNATPPGVRVTRATVPPGVERVIGRALAKVAADRFGTAREFSKALAENAGTSGAEQPSPIVPHRRPGRVKRSVVGGLVVAGTVVGMWQLWPSRPPALDSNRVVVFPLRDTRIGSSGSVAGEEVATYIGYALDGSEPLRWLDGWDRLSAREQAGAEAVSVSSATEISRAEGARYFIDGSIIRSPDSVTIVLRLHDVEGDSLVGRAGSTQAAAMLNLPHLGLQAVSRLLPVLLEPGRTIDLSPFADRRPVAVADFLQGERYYRRMRFREALPLYQRAVAADSEFAVAALKGAWSAVWEDRYDEARRMTAAVVDRRTPLPARYTAFAAGLLAYLDGAADSAVAHFGLASRLDDRWVEAWAALGEAHYHLLPSQGPVDSLAERFFGQAEALDSNFSPALVHLAYAAIRKADLPRAQALIDRLRVFNPGSSSLASLELMHRCVRDGAAAIDWPRHARDSLLILTAKNLAPGLFQPDCARTAYQVVFASTRATPNQRWGALLGLQGILAAQGRRSEISRLLDSEAALMLGGEVLHLVLGAAGLVDTTRAVEVARRLGTDYQSEITPNLWALGLWESWRRDTVRLKAIVQALASREREGDRTDSLIGRALGLHLTLLRGDSTEALAGLSALVPSAPPADLEWQPWEALGAEKILLADLYLARRQPAEALAVAAQFDSPQPVIYSVYLPASLAIRERAAALLGLDHAARHYRARASALRGELSDRGAQLTHTNR